MQRVLYIEKYTFYYKQIANHWTSLFAQRHTHILAYLLQMLCLSFQEAISHAYQLKVKF